MGKQIIESVVSGGYTFGKEYRDDGGCPNFVFRCDKTGVWFTCDKKEAEFLSAALVGNRNDCVIDDKRIKISVVKSGGEVILCHSVHDVEVKFNLAEDESIALGNAMCERFLDCNIVKEYCW